MIEVSVITPVYNTAPWLKRCIESVLAQTIRDIEVICVDDGSTDGSTQLLKEAAAGDSRIQPVFLRHQGVSTARNMALDRAVGEYIFFLDSDDWIDPDHLEAMLRLARKGNLDVVVNTSFVKEFDDHTEAGDTFGLSAGEGAYYPSAQVQSHVLSALCLRMYRRTYLNRHDIRFPLISGGGEDIYFTALAEVLQEKTFVFDGPAYHYYQREGSIVHMRERAFPYICNYKALYEELLRRGIPCQDLKLLYSGIIEIDTREKFDFIRSYLSQVEAIIRRHPEYYTGHDMLLLEAVMESPDYDEYLQKHHPNIAIEYIRSKMRKARNNG